MKNFLEIEVIQAAYGSISFLDSGLVYLIVEMIRQGKTKREARKLVHFLFCLYINSGEKIKMGKYACSLIKLLLPSCRQTSN